MRELRKRIVGRIVLLVLLFIASLIPSGAIKFLVWIFGGSLGFRGIFWTVFSAAVTSYAIWYLIYKIVFDAWIIEFNNKIRTGMKEEAAIKYANQKSKLRPPLKIALRFAENRRFWEA